MLQNHFKIAFRNLLRNRNYTLVNIAGLAAGISVCLIIFMIIRFEMSFDNFHSKKDRIYRVLTEYHHADAANIFYGRGVPFPLPAAMQNFRQVEKATPVWAGSNDQILVLGDQGEPLKKFKEEKGVFLTQPAFFEIFDFPWLAGDAATALKDPNSAVLSRETAEKYFGDWKSAVGKTIKWNNGPVLKITGILAPIPANTDFQLKVVISYRTGPGNYFAKSTNWDGTGSSFGCYLLLAPNASVNAFNSSLRDLSKKMKTPGNKDSHIIQPLGQVHYDTEAGDYSGKSMSLALIRTLWTIAGFILIIACVNFINLSTAQAVNRAKEVGVRKVMGSNRRQLQLQFLSETFLIVIASLLLAIVITGMVIPAISRIVENKLSLKALLTGPAILFLTIIPVLVTLLAGFYPALVLSRFNPIQALKSRLAASSTKGISLRKSLVVLQFVIAQALIIGTLVIVYQMNYFNSKPLGFDKNAIVNIPFPEDSIGRLKQAYLRQRLTGMKGIDRVSFSSNTPVEDNNDNWTTFRYNRAEKETDFYAINKWADPEFLSTYHLPLVAGRNLLPSDTVKEFLVNETLLKSLAVANPQDALNKEVSMWDGYLNGRIVGVIRDFHDRSFRAPFAPLIISTMKSGYNQAGIKLSTQDIPGTMKAIEKTWNEVFPDFVFEYQFLDTKIDSFYREENKLSRIYKIFAGIAIFLSCLGLYGLASFMAVQRIKEVGIRKVLGASAGSIVYLFSREFLFLIGIAFLIATPLAWYFMRQWLQDYVYRIDMSWWIFAIGGALSLLIALFTVSSQAIRAALTNPVKSLRSE